VRKNFLIGFFFLGLTACGYYREEFIVDQAQTAQEGPKTLGYDTVNAVLKNNRCLECHSDAGRNRGRVNLETYEKVKARAAAILDQIDQGFMPDDNGPRVSAEDRQILGEWVDAGMPL
jgi:uncharacterized membrane protein